MKMERKHPSFCDEYEETLYKIGMFAQLNRTTVKALRFYEEQGLLYPAFVDEENGYRYYRLGQMADLHKISALKNMGLTLDNIKSLNNGADISRLLSKKKAEYLAQIAELTAKLAEIENFLEGDISRIENPVLIKKIPEITIATMEDRIESYDSLFDMMPKMGGEMEKLGLICAQPEYCFTEYLEEGYKEDNILVKTCQTVTGKIKEGLDIRIEKRAEIQAACIFHKGSYNDFHKSYQSLLLYIEENGYRIVGPIRESYIDGVWNQESESEWLSEIQIPVEKRD